MNGWTSTILPTTDPTHTAQAVLGDLSADGYQMYVDVTPCFWEHIKAVTGCCDGSHEWYVSNGVATQSHESDGQPVRFGVVLNTLPTPNRFIFANEAAVGLFETSPPCLPPPKVTPTDIVGALANAEGVSGQYEGSGPGDGDETSFGAGVLNIMGFAFPLWALLLLLVVVARD